MLYSRTHPPTTGRSVHGHQLVRHLRERGHRLFSFRGADANPQMAPFRWWRTGSYLRTIDVLYVRAGWSMRSTFAWLRRLSLGRLPVVWELNGRPEEMLLSGMSPRDLARRERRFRRLARHVGAAVGVCPGVVRYLREEIGIERCFHIPNGSDPDLFRPARRGTGRDQPLRVAWLGRVRSPWHDWAGVLDMARILHDEGANVTFTVFGEAEDLPDTLPPNVHCAGLLPYARLGKALDVQDVGLHLFREDGPAGQIDGSPLKLFDCMAAGMAIVARDRDGLRAPVGDRQAGFLIRGGAREAAARLRELEQDRTLCRRLGLNGRKAVEDYYHWPRVAKEVEAALEAAIATNS